MVELLLITDIPRLIKLFSQLSEEQGVSLHIATDLDSGAREIAACKPGIIFVQTHLSGFSADIILMHLKKLLGKRHSRFVLLCDPGQISNEILQLYHGHIDTSLEDSRLLGSVMELATTSKTKSFTQPDLSVAFEDTSTEEQNALFASETAADQDSFVALRSSIAASKTESQTNEGNVNSSTPTPDEQGIAYPPRKAVSVYSEFTSTFDSAVNSQQASQADNWNNHEQEIIEVDNKPARSKTATFLLWAVPLFVVVIAFTLYQHKVSFRKEPSGSTSAKQDKLPAITLQPGTGKAAPSPTQENPLPVHVAPRLAKLPAFIPAEERDKKYSKLNPGWERYRGRSMDFKVYREDSAITAIQVIDRSGKGIPESFLQSVLVKLAKSPVFLMESSEKKDGYEIQRGRVTENLKTVYYRDAEGGKLRAFVVSWQ